MSEDLIKNIKEHFKHFHRKPEHKVEQWWKSLSEKERSALINTYAGVCGVTAVVGAMCPEFSAVSLGIASPLIAKTLSKEIKEFHHLESSIKKLKMII